MKLLKKANVNICWLMVIISLLVALVGCNKEIIDGKDGNDLLQPRTSAQILNVQINKKYYPVFMGVQEGKAALKDLVFGSQGWWLDTGEDYVFAIYGHSVVRYNIDKNEIDTIINLGESYKGWPTAVSVSSKGNHLIIYDFDFGNSASCANYFLIDIKKEKTTPLAEKYDKSKHNEFREKIPEEVRGEVEGFRFKSEESTKVSDEVMDLILKKNNINKYSLDNIINIKDNKSCAFIPYNEELTGYLGYYQFVVFDEKGNVIQQCELNIHSSRGSLEQGY